MAGKKHPILIVMVILLICALFMVTAMVVVWKMAAPSSTIYFSERIGVIPINGEISEPLRITSQLVEFKKDKRIKAIILRIDSPGGGVGPSQEIHREVQKTAQSKTVIASMGGVAASGAYYIAAAANKIVADPGTITGSIGVIMQFVHLEELIDKVGIKFEVLKSGEFKDIGSSHRKMTKTERELLNALIADVQKQFVEAVAEGRNMDPNKVQEIADGRVFTGAQAKELGLVDDLGNFQDAVQMAKKMVGIKGEVELVYPKRTRMELWDLFLKSAAKSVLELFQGMKTKVEYRWDGPAES